MAREFVGCQRGQMLLMPPSLSEWLPEDHLVWSVLGAVEPEAVVGDAGYWHTRQIQAIADRGIEVLVPPDRAMRDGHRPGREGGL